jgi:hypothetical protein
MEMAAYLTPAAREVMALVSQKVHFVENGSACHQYEIFGFFSATRRELTVCSRRIVGFGSPDRDINETLMHESVHVAQACRGDFRYLRAFGVKSSAMPLSAAKAADLRKVLAFDSRLAQIDREAFYMENKPGLVAYVVRKYCF